MKSFYVNAIGQTSLLIIPGIGKTFVKDFARIGMYFVEDFENKVPELIYKKLVDTNLLGNHKTSKNYLYVIKMVVYYAGGGREVNSLKWSFWKLDNLT